MTECNCPKCRADRGETVMSVEAAAAKLRPIMENFGTVAEALLKTIREMKGPNATPKDVGQSFANAIMTILFNFAEGSIKPGAPATAKYEYFRHLAMSGMNSNIEEEKKHDAEAAITDMPEGVRAVMEALDIDPSNVTVIRGGKL